MNFNTFLNDANFGNDDESSASLTPAFCPEIIALLNSKNANAMKTFSRFMNPNFADYGFDEHAYGLSHWDFSDKNGFSLYDIDSLFNTNIKVLNNAN